MNELENMLKEMKAFKDNDLKYFVELALALPTNSPEQVSEFKSKIKSYYECVKIERNAK